MSTRLRAAFESPYLAALIGAAVLAASLTLTGNLSVGGTSTFTGASTFSGDVTLSGATTDLAVGGDLTMTDGANEGSILHASFEAFAGGAGIRLGTDGTDPAIVQHAGNPEGATTRAKASLLLDTTNANLWQNVAGGTDWKKLIDDDDTFTSGAAGLAPASGGGTANYLRADGTWTAPAGGTSTFSGASVYKTSSQNIPSAGSWNVITYDAETYDTDGYHSTVSNTSRLTVPTTAYYHVCGSIMYPGNATGLRYVQFYKNGTTEIGRTPIVPSGASEQSVPRVCITLSLTAGDYIELRAFQDSGSTLAAEAQQYAEPFEIFRIGT